MNYFRYFSPIFVIEFNFFLVYSKCYVTWKIVLKKTTKQRFMNLKFLTHIIYYKKNTYIIPNLPIGGRGDYVHSIFAKCILYVVWEQWIYDLFKFKGFQFSYFILHWFYSAINKTLWTLWVLHRKLFSIK